jgi:hypothetical protein
MCPIISCKRGQAIEQAGNDKAQSVEARFGVPTPARDGEQVAELPGKAGEVGLADRLGRRCRVKVYGNLKLSGSLKDGKEARIVKEKASCGAIKKSAMKAETGDAAIKFDGCRAGILEDQRGKAGKAIGVVPNRIGELIIDIVSHWSRGGGIERVEPHGRERENLKVDSSLVHIRDAAGAEIEEFGLKLRELRRSARAVGSGGSEEGCGYEVLFERNGAHQGWTITS